MTRLLEKVWPEKKAQSEEVITEKIIERETIPEEVMEREESPIYTGEIGVTGMLFNLINGIFINKVSGHWVFKHSSHRKDFRDTVRLLEIAMELLDLDQQFRRDIAVAPRQPNSVEVSYAKLTACFKFINRSKLSVPEQYQETEYKPNIQEFESRELEGEDI